MKFFGDSRFLKITVSQKVEPIIIIPSGYVSNLVKLYFTVSLGLHLVQVLKLSEQTSKFLIYENITFVHFLSDYRYNKISILGYSASSISHTSKKGL